MNIQQRRWRLWTGCAVCAALLLLILGLVLGSTLGRKQTAGVSDAASDALEAAASPTPVVTTPTTTTPTTTTPLPATETLPTLPPVSPTPLAPTQGADQATASPQPSAVVSSPADLGNYVNDSLGISLELPKDWTAKEKEGLLSVTRDGRVELTVKALDTLPSGQVEHLRSQILKEAGEAIGGSAKQLKLLPTNVGPLEAQVLVFALYDAQGVKTSIQHYFYMDTAKEAGYLLTLGVSTDAELPTTDIDAAEALLQSFRLTAGLSLPTYKGELASYTHEGRGYQLSFRYPKQVDMQLIALSTGDLLFLPEQGDGLTQLLIHPVESPVGSKPDLAAYAEKLARQYQDALGGKLSLLTLGGFAYNERPQQLLQLEYEMDGKKLNRYEVISLVNNQLIHIQCQWINGDAETGKELRELATCIYQSLNLR